jgi:hypothetical protein
MEKTTKKFVAIYTFDEIIETNTYLFKEEKYLAK